MIYMMQIKIQSIKQNFKFFLSEYEIYKGNELYALNTKPNYELVENIKKKDSEKFEKNFFKTINIENMVKG